MHPDDTTLLPLWWALATATTLAMLPVILDVLAVIALTTAAVIAATEAVDRW